jgi:hypothetical protein
VGSRLHGDGVEPSLISFDVALQQSDEVTGCAHGLDRVALRTGVVVYPRPFDAPQ